MFFFIGGVQPKTIILDKNPRTCSVCGRMEVQKKRVDQYLSIFFIPLFPIKKGTPFLQCSNCRTVFDESGIELDEADHMFGCRCPKCGRPVSRKFSYCPYCGNSL